MSNDEIKCRYCKESVPKAAIFCKHCKNKIGISGEDKTEAFMGWLLMIILIGVGIYSCSSNSEIATNTSSSDTSTISDIQKLSDYHIKFMALENPLDDASKQFSKSLKNDIQNGNLYALYADAKTLNDLAESTCYQVTTSFEVPNFNNSQVQSYIQNTYDAFNNYCVALTESSKSIMEMANNPTPETIANAKDENLRDTSWANQSAQEIAINLTQAYQTLGYDLNRVDIKNGGLLSKDSSIK